jgi:hypothetical protein
MFRGFNPRIFEHKLGAPFEKGFLNIRTYVGRIDKDGGDK